MTNWKIFPRFLLFISLMLGLLAGMTSPVTKKQTVSAAPLSASLRDVVISEVAWGGTAASANDEWVELHNTTNSAISLTGWTLISSDTTPSLSLNGTIPANGYYLIECSTDNNTISNMAADFLITGTCSSNFSNSGEVLTLRDNLSNEIDTANSGSSSWYAGSGSPDYFSMERVDFNADNASAWVSNNGITRNGLDASSNPINGTPRNSQIDLSLSLKTKSISGITPPFNVTYTLILTNLGFGTATAIDITDNFPSLAGSGVTYSSHAASSGTYNNGTGVWSVPSLAYGSSATLDITVATTAASLVTYSAQITASGQSDPVTSNNSDTTKIGLPLLNISNLVSNPTPNIGSNVVFTLSVTNPSATISASNVLVDALLPSGLTYVSDNSGGSYNGTTGLWNIGNLAIGGSATISITATVSSNGVKNFVVDVSSIEFANNSATSTVNPFGGLSDLSLIQTLTKSPTAVGQVIFTLTITNSGPYDATNVEVRDLLPSGVTYVSDNGGGFYNRTTGIWSVGTLPTASPTKTLTITARVNPSGTMTNAAEVWKSDQTDSDSTPGNSSTTEDDDASVEIKISDLSVSETVDISGVNAVFTVRVSNAGPDGATGVVVKTMLPDLTSAYTFVSYGSTQGSYTASSGEWNVGSLANGASATLTITTTMSSSLIVNWVEVKSSDQVDPDSVPNNNSRTEDDDSSAPSADLSVTQTASNLNPDINTNVVLTITVTNAGAAGTTNVQVRDMLPIGLTYVSYTSTAGTSYSNSTGIWTVGSLANGQSKVLNITTKVSTYGILTNWAEVWQSDESDPDSNPRNNSTIEDDDASVTITSYRSIIINEIAWSGTASSAEDEWLELYNPSSVAINVTGWTLKSASGSLNITLSGTVNAGGYFLLERGDNTTISDTAADQIYSGTGSGPLSDGGEVLTLRDGSGNFIDTANNEGSTSASNPWPKGLATSNHNSMERVGTSTELDKNWVSNLGNPKNGLDADNGFIYGTPRRANSVGTAVAPTPTLTRPGGTSLAGRPIINEFLVRPGFDWNQDGKVDVYDEFIEIKNIGNADISISGWKLEIESGRGSGTFALPAQTLKVGQRLIFYALQSNLLLSDGGDTIRLISSNGEIFDAYTYGIAKVEDETVCRLPDGNGSWYEDCIPTPNFSNSREGTVPSMPGEGFESPVCELPDTLPADFLFAECRGYGSNMWRAFYWDVLGWQGSQYIGNTSRWESFVE
ncbi:MAG: DUF11 domain-containing protein [Anaerolineales bacterium]|nr:DUF11 domain-containing protein [Anaerolineales bacterium]